MNIEKILVVSVLISGLVACSTTPSQDAIVYEGRPPEFSKQTVMTSVDPIEIPTEVSSTPKVENKYAVPTTTAQIGSDKKVSLLPPGSALEETTQQSQQTALSAGILNTPSAQPTPTSISPPPPSAPPAPSPPVITSVSVKMPFTQAWAKIGKALPTAGYPVMEEDNFSGTYYVLDKVGSGGTIKRDTPIYQVHLEKQGDKTSITLLDAQNKPADTKASSRILGALKSKVGT